jgi:hypothetical protein
MTLTTPIWSNRLVRSIDEDSVVAVRTPSGNSVEDAALTAEQVHNPPLMDCAEHSRKTRSLCLFCA